MVQPVSARASAAATSLRSIVDDLSSTPQPVSTAPVTLWGTSTQARRHTGTRCHCSACRVPFPTRIHPHPTPQMRVSTLTPSAIRRCQQRRTSRRPVGEPIASRPTALPGFRQAQAQCPSVHCRQTHSRSLAYRPGRLCCLSGLQCRGRLLRLRLHRSALRFYARERTPLIPATFGRPIPWCSLGALRLAESIQGRCIASEFSGCSPGGRSPAIRKQRKQRMAVRRMSGNQTLCMLGSHSTLYFVAS